MKRTFPNSTMRTPARIPKTPMSRQNSAESMTDPVEVYCRVRPTNGTVDESCVDVVSNKTVSLKPPESSKTTIQREVQYTFKYVFNQYSNQQNQFRMQLVRTEQDLSTLRNENTRLSEMLKMERSRTQIHERKIETMECQIDEIMRKLQDRETTIKELQTQNNQKQCALKEMEVQQIRQKRKFETKIANETEKTNRQLTKEFKEREDMINDRLRTKEQKMREIMRIVQASSTEHLDALPPQNKERAAIINSVSMTPRATKTSTIRGTPMANIRYQRRSKSTDERWLEHQSKNPVPLGTILQPNYRNHKSITKLTDAKDIVNAKTSKYCLVSQGADTDGEMETRFYKGNVIPTCGGGAQVVFNDVECLKQKSPIAGSQRKRTSQDEQLNNPEDIAARCSVGFQGSKKSKC